MAEGAGPRRKREVKCYFTQKISIFFDEISRQTIFWKLARSSMSLRGDCGIIQTTSRKKEVPDMLYAIVSLVVLGGAMAVSR